MAVLQRLPDLDRVVDALVEAGIGVVAVTLDTDDALAAISRLRQRGDVTVFAGTVRTGAEAAAAVAAGAEGCVGPAFVPAVVDQCLELGVPSIPGALTPTEIEAAWRAGAAMVSVFPVGLGGPGYLRHVRGTLGEIPLLAAGGVDARNASEFLAAGAAAVGIGSSLSAAKDVGAEARRILAAVRQAS